MSFKKKILATLLAILTLLTLAACGNKDQDGASGGGNGEEGTNTITFGTSADYAPYEFHTMINGVDTIVGADIVLAEKIAEKMGKELVIKDISFDALLNELQGGTIDFVIASMSSTADRVAQASPSDPYHGKDYQRVLFKAVDAEKFTSFDDFGGAKVGVQAGAIQVGLAEDNLTGCELLVLQSVPDLVNNLANGKCDAVLLDGSVAEGYAASNPELMILDIDFPATEGSCVWVQKGDPMGLLDDINAVIAEVGGEFEAWLEEAGQYNEN